MTNIRDVCEFLEAFAPLDLAEDWDNVGLLVGREEDTVENVMTCLTVTPETVLEAAERNVNLIVSHHPLPFRPLQKITDETTTGGMLLDLIAHGVAVYSPHTAFDSASNGVNQQWCERLGLSDVKPMQPDAAQPEVGGGRYGRLAQSVSLGALGERVRQAFSLQGAHVVGDAELDVAMIAVACGAAGMFLEPAIAAGCDVLLTGETSFHTCLEAKARGAGLILVGHYHSERFAVEQLAVKLAVAFPQLEIWPSHRESDPVSWIM